MPVGVIAPMSGHTGHFAQSGRKVREAEREIERKKKERRKKEREGYKSFGLSGVCAPVSQ